jgi:hypothetical protein
MQSTVTCLTAVLFAPLVTLHAADRTEPDFIAMSSELVRQYELNVLRRVANLALIPPKLNTSAAPVQLRPPHHAAVLPSGLPSAGARAIPVA